MELSSWPTAVAPLFANEAPNQPISVYKGRFDLVAGGTTLPASGALRLEWLPRPRLVADLQVPEGMALPLSDSSTSIDAVSMERLGTLKHPSFVRQVTSDSGETRVELNALEANFGSSRVLDELIFHVVNLPNMQGNYIRDASGTRAWSGRQEFSVAGWNYAIDARENISRVVDDLNSNGGYSITHVGRLTREDGSSFSGDQASVPLSGLQFLFAVIRGAWSPHIAIVGAHQGQQVCEQWSVLGRSDGWARMLPWWHPLTRNLAQELAPTVIEQVREEGSAVRYGITWYTEARRLENSVETPLILAQAGLELMAWDVGVRRKAAFSPLGFDRLRAEDRLRYLFSLMRLELPAERQFDDVRQFLQKNGVHDLAQLISQVRNNVIHPPRREAQVERVPVEVRIDASRLAIWALEMSLLYVLDYRGKHANRWRDFHPPDAMPWSRD